MFLPVAELIRSRFFLLMGISEWRAVPLFPRDRFSFCFSLTEMFQLHIPVRIRLAYHIHLKEDKSQ